MAVKASANITLFDMVDIDGVTNYYLLQSSTANPPAKPTTDNPGGNWSTTEPTYTEGSTNTLYTVMKTKFSDGTFEYTPVSKSSSYEAAKSAYNKASNAQTTANTANDKIDNLQIGGRNYISNLVNNWANANWSIPDVGGTSVLNDYNGRISLKKSVSVEPGANYWVKLYSSKSVYVLFRLLDEDKKFITSNIGMTNQKWTCPTNCYYVNVTIYENSTIADIENGTTKIKFEKGTKATDWTQAPEDIDETIINLDSKHDYVVGTQTAATRFWTGVSNLTSLKDGQEIMFWLPYATAYTNAGDRTVGVNMRVNSSTTKTAGTTIISFETGTSTNVVWLNLTLKGGNSTGWIPCYYGGTQRLTSHYGAGNAIRLVYRVNAKVGGEAATAQYTGWFADANYVDGNTYDRIRYNQNFKAKVAINKYNFIGAWEDGLYLPIVAGAEIDITKPILYFNSSSNIAANATNSNGYLSYPAVSLRNTISGWTGTLYASVYLKGELNGNLFTLDETDPYTCTVPTSDDGNTYVLLGQCIGNNYSVTLIPEHPLYRFFDGEFKALSQIAADYRAELNESISNAQANAIAAAAQNTSNQMNNYNETIKATYSTKTDVTTDINKTYALIQQNFVTNATYNNMDDRVNSAEATLAVLRSAITQFAGYYLTDEIPDDWATNYTDYYIKNSNNAYIHVTGSTAPTWAANTYYKAGAYMEISSGNSNLKLRLENDIIRLMSGTTTLTKWRTDLFQVYQTITRVLNIGPPNAGHFSFIFNDDGSLSIRKVT